MADDAHCSRQEETLVRLPIGELIAWHLMAACDPLPNRACRDGARSRGAFRLRTAAGILGDAAAVQGATVPPAPDRRRLRSKFPALPGPAVVEVWLKGQSRL